MYKVSRQEINSFGEAVSTAKRFNTCVIESATGLVRWRPAINASIKKVQVYNLKQAA